MIVRERLSVTTLLQPINMRLEAAGLFRLLSNDWLEETILELMLIQVALCR